MFSISIGGPCSGAGKTELLCTILKSFPDRFTAVKWSVVICPQGHCRSEKNRCECGRLEGDSPGYVIEERNSELAAAGKDTGRYLTSGARRVFWVVSRRAKAPLALAALLTGWLRDSMALQRRISQRKGAALQRRRLPHRSRGVRDLRPRSSNGRIDHSGEISGQKSGRPGDHQAGGVSAAARAARRGVSISPDDRAARLSFSYPDQDRPCEGAQRRRPRQLRGDFSRRRRNPGIKQAAAQALAVK